MTAQPGNLEQKTKALQGFALHPNFVVRIGGEAASGLHGLEEGKAAACWQQICDLESELNTISEPLCSLLEGKVPEAEDRDTTRAFINAKRVVFAGKRISNKDFRLASEALESSGEAGPLLEYSRVVEALAAVNAELEHAHAADFAATSAAVAKLAEHANLRTGLSYSTPALSQSIRSAFDPNREKPLKAKSLRNVEDSTLQYFARCSTKTSPLSSFTPSHVGEWKPGSGETTLDLSGSMIRKIEMKSGLLRYIMEPVLKDFGFIRANLPVKINGSVKVEDGAIQYQSITPGQEVSGRTFGTGLQVANLPANPLMQCLGAVLAERGNAPMMADELVETVCAKVNGIAEDQMWAFVAKMLSIDFLQADNLLLEQADIMGWARTIIELKGFPQQDRARELIGEISSALSIMEGDDVAARELAAVSVRQLCLDLAACTGADPKSELFSKPFHENCYLQDAQNALDPMVLAPFGEELQLVAELSHLLDPNQELHSRLADFFVEKFGKDGRCEDVAGFLREFDALYAPGVLDKQIEFDKIAADSAHTKRLLDAKVEFDRLLDPFLQSEEDVQLDLGKLRAITEMATPEMRNRRASYSHVVQFARENERELLVLNQVFGGRSSIMSRFLEVLDSQQVSRVRDYIRAGSTADVVAELPGVFGFNANRHPPLADETVSIAPFPRPDAERPAIDFDTLSLVFDADAHRVVFCDEGGRSVDVLYQGLLIPALMPQMHRVLSLAFTEGPSFAIMKSVAQRVMSGGRTIATLPRIAIGNVVLLRRSTIMRNTLLPDAGVPPHEFYRAVREWQNEHNLPTKFFIRSLPMVDETNDAESAGKVDWGSVNFKDMKPFYVDLDSPRFVRLLQNMMKRSDLAVCISELLPDFESSPFSVDRTQRVAELHFEMTANEPVIEPDKPIKHRIRIAYFEQERAALLGGPVAEAVKLARAHSAVGQVQVTTHWQFGPHVDLMIEAPSKPFLTNVYPQVAKVLEDWLGENPSTTELDADEYTQLSRNIAVFELNPGPYVPLLRNNRIAFAPIEEPVGLAIPQLNDERSRFLDQSLDLVLETTALKSSDPSEFFRVLSTMLFVVADCFKNGMQEGYMSLRSHADYFFAAHDVGGKARKGFDRFNEQHAQTFDAIARAVNEKDWAGLPMGPKGRALIAQWADVVDRTELRSRNMVAANYDALVAQTVHEDLARSMADGDENELRERLAGRAISKIGKVFLNTDRGQAAQRSPDFLTYRTVVNFFYLLLPIMDVPPVQKFMLCDLVSRSVERVFDRDWQKTIGLEAAE